MSTGKKKKDIDWWGKTIYLLLVVFIMIVRVNPEQDLIVLGFLQTENTRWSQL